MNLVFAVALLGLPVSIARAQTGGGAAEEVVPPPDQAQMVAPVPEPQAPPPPPATPAGPPVPVAYGGAPVLAGIPLADPVEAERLGAWIEYIRGREKFGRIFAGTTLTVTGPVLAGLGVWLMADWQFHTSADDSLIFTTLGAISVGVGGLSLATGIAMLAMPLPSEDRFEGWEAERQDGIDLRELARYEGELRGLADLGRFSRRLGMIGAIGLAVGGGAAMIVTAVSDPVGDDSELFGYIVGGAFAIAGVATFGMSFIPSPQERVWRKYLDGERPEGGSPPPPSVTAGIAPVPGGAAMSVAGSF